MTVLRSYSRLMLQPSLVGRTRCANSYRTTIIWLLISFWLITFADFHLNAQETSSPPAWSDSRNNWQSPHPAVVRIISDDGNATSYGSGTLVARGEKVSLVVTNWHVVRDAKGEITVAFPDGFRSSARVAKMDRDWDLAALVIWSPKVEAVPIAKRAAQPGDPLAIAGYGSGQYRLTSGHCTQYVAPGLNFPYEMLELSAEARQGDSGGPIFNSQGDLAGVLFGAGRGTTSGSYSGRVYQFLQPLMVKLTPRRAVGQFASTSIPAVVDRSATQPLASAGKTGGQVSDRNQAAATADDNSANQEPIPDPDQGQMATDAVAQLPKQTNSVTSPGKPGRRGPKREDQSAGSAGVSDTTGSPEFRLVPVHPKHASTSLFDQQPVSVGSDTRFKMVSSSDQSGTGAQGERMWRRFAGDSIFDQAKSILALLGVFYIAMLLIRRSE